MRQTGTIGIIGGGQLGQMLTQAALPLGFQVIVIDPTENCPAAQAGAQQIKAGFYDAAAIQELAERADYLTVETEHVNTEILAKLDKPVNPTPRTVATIQDKLAQKNFLQKRGIPIAPFAPIIDQASAERLLQEWGTIYLKTTHGGFDGRGNELVKDKEYLARVTAGDQKLYAEQAVNLKKELAVMVVRGNDGTIAHYPVTETMHERSICVETLTPAQVSPDVAEQAAALALKTVDQLEGAGVFGVEMFLTADDQLLVNEIAPRVHNSGHYTIEACETSQFENHIRAIAGLPLGPTNMTVPAAVMVNILGERDGPVELRGVEQAEAEPHTTVHIYGKTPTKTDRKMGHITAVGDTLVEAKQQAESARKLISI